MLIHKNKVKININQIINLNIHYHKNNLLLRINLIRCLVKLMFSIGRIKNIKIKRKLYCRCLPNHKNMLKFNLKIKGLIIVKDLVQPILSVLEGIEIVLFNQNQKDTDNVKQLNKNKYDQLDQLSHH